MKDLYSVIIENKFNTETNAEFSVNEGLQMINESFKASILSRLAKKVSDAEKDYNKSQKEWENKSGRKQSLRTFASIFAPIDTDIVEKDGRTYRATRAIKWADITDSDFKVFDSCDKELTKLIKSTYGKKTEQALFIIATGDDILNVVRAYGHAGMDGGVYYFLTNHKFGNGVKQMLKDHYKYQQRSLKVNEVIDFVTDILDDESVRCYALKITSDMIAEYNNLIGDRKEAQKGVINYDKASLKTMLQEQQARYEALVKKMKADKAKGNVDKYLEKINSINKEVVELTEKAMKTPEYVAEYSSVGDLMSTVAYLYGTIYDFVYHSKKADDNVKRWREEDEKNGKEFDEEKYRKWDFDSRDAERSIQKLDEYIRKIEKDIQYVKDRVEGKYSK